MTRTGATGKPHPLLGMRGVGDRVPLDVVTGERVESSAGHRAFVGAEFSHAWHRVTARRAFANLWSHFICRIAWILAVLVRPHRGGPGAGQEQHAPALGRGAAGCPTTPGGDYPCPVRPSRRFVTGTSCPCEARRPRGATFSTLPRWPPTFAHRLAQLSLYNHRLDRS